MPPSRASASELAKLLESVPEPVYALDNERRIRFFNSACRDWLGATADELLGTTCNYHCSPEVNGAAALAAALCPPPEAFVGRRVSASIVLPLAELNDARRGVEFVPLAGERVAPAGVLAFVSAPLPPEAAELTAEEPAEKQLHGRLQRYRRRLAVRYHVDRLWGDSPAMRRVRAQVKLAAAAATSVVVVGPEGSGRQHVARAIHYGADRATAGSLVPLACAMLDSDLLRASLRALARTKSAQRPASLLLEDADQLSEAAQADLALLLSAGEFPARVISTASLSPVDLSAWGRFRHDLACLLSTVVIQLPSLSERLEDLPLVAQWYLEQANARGAKQLGGFTPEALDSLAAYAWPGDLDELEKCVAECHARAAGPLVTPRDLPRRLHLAADASALPRKPDEPIKLDEFMAKIERELVERALRRSKGNKAKAARLLGMNRPRLYRRVVQLGMEEAYPGE